MLGVSWSGADFCAMAEYTAFYDTSGSRERLHSEAAIVTVGLLATTAQWAE